MGRSYFKAQTEGWLFLPFSQTDSANGLHCSNHSLDQILKKRNKTEQEESLSQQEVDTGQTGKDLTCALLLFGAAEMCFLFIVEVCICFNNET